MIKHHVVEEHKKINEKADESAAQIISMQRTLDTYVKLNNILKCLGRTNKRVSEGYQSYVRYYQQLKVGNT
jgi:hypothetical protein